MEQQFPWSPEAIIQKVRSHFVLTQERRELLEEQGIKFLFPNALVRLFFDNNIYNLADLIQLSEEDLLDIPRVGKVRIASIKKFLAVRGLFLNMIFLDLSKVESEKINILTLLEKAKPEWFLDSWQERSLFQKFFLDKPTVKALFSEANPLNAVRYQGYFLSKAPAKDKKALRKILHKFSIIFGYYSSLQK